ncbi:aminotransferase class V-fold PLP-dependent enzyme [Shimia sediminis]|uniref:aminotransferase class V-fold PLP-dependent enzyme n=1 Tax=Shimia sediminis TaxID=2497945 RepID=UPI001F159762|nr:aminotransferase class V-fold PLP-dependent enzyme [Shimia sediminis]
MTDQIDTEFVRGQFPGLSNGWILMDNAGGSQILQSGIDRISGFLTNEFVQHGGSYELSQKAENTLHEARCAAQLLVNAELAEEIIFASSSTVSIANLARAMKSQFAAGDEIILSTGDHESNIGAWEQFEKIGVTVKFWPVDPVSLTLKLDDLEPLLSDKVKLVCVHHVSNILGVANPVKEIAEVVHKYGAKICVDGVAFAPHRAVDVQDWDIDFYVMSLYKFYGPHCSVLYGKYELLLELDPIYHNFYGKEIVPGKLEPGDPNYELTSAIPCIPEYLIELGRRSGGQGSSRELLCAGFEAITRQEDYLVNEVLRFLGARNNCSIVGPAVNVNSSRLPIISFKVGGMDADEICQAMDKYKIAIRFGEFHANRLIESLKASENNGVVRISLAHYNTIEEVRALIAALTQVFEGQRYEENAGCSQA